MLETKTHVVTLKKETLTIVNTRNIFRYKPREEVEFTLNCYIQ